jgi:predicted phosphodiesterase
MSLEWLTGKEIRAALNLSERTFYRRVNSGQILRKRNGDEVSYAIPDGSVHVYEPEPINDTEFGIKYDGDVKRYSVKTPGRVRVNLDAARVDYLLRSVTHEQTAALLQELAKAPAATPVSVPASVTGEPVYVALTDVHIGQNGGGGNIPGAALRVVQDLAKLGPISEVIYPVGSDLVHIDTYARTTTKGTHIASAMGARESLLHAVNAMASIVSLTLLAGYKVRLTYCAGNHDRVASYSVMLALMAWFRNEPNVLIDSIEINERSYLDINGTMVAVMHGDTHKPEQMPMLAAVEAPEIWGRCKHRYIMCGHRHHFLKGDAHGCTVVQARSPAAASEYDRLQGYHSPRSIQGFRLGERFACVTEPV